MTVIAIANQKGGVAKTTSAIHLASYYASQGARVLVIDLDAQGHAASARLSQARAHLERFLDKVAGEMVSQRVTRQIRRFCIRKRLQQFCKHKRAKQFSFAKSQQEMRRGCLTR